jgi:N-methylhydantoinase A
VVGFAVTAIGRIDLPQLPRPEAGTADPPAPALLGTRPVFFEGGAGWRDCPIWQRESLLAGNRLPGPAVIEEISATTVLYPGDLARVDAVGSLIVEVGQ